MKKAREVKPSEVKDEIASLNKIFRRTKTLIKTIALILAFFFTWLEFRNIMIAREVIPLLTDKLSNTFFKIVIVIYYFSWLAGTSKDLDDEEYTFLTAPNSGKLSISALGSMAVLAGLFAWLCGASTPKSIAIVLTTFFISNVLGWIYLKWYIKEAIEKSIEKYENRKDNLGLYKISIIKTYLWGKWEIYRFITGFIILLILDIFAFSNLSQIITKYLMLPSSQFLIVFMFFVYVIIMEIWIWFYRIERNITFKVVNKLKEVAQIK
jgi:hypothetical protein